MLVLFDRRPLQRSSSSPAARAHRWRAWRHSGCPCRPVSSCADALVAALAETVAAIRAVLVVARRARIWLHDRGGAGARAGRRFGRRVSERDRRGVRASGRPRASPCAVRDRRGLRDRELRRPAGDLPARSRRRARSSNASATAGRRSSASARSSTATIRAPWPTSALPVRRGSKYPLLWRSRSGSDGAKAAVVSVRASERGGARGRRWLGSWGDRRAWTR